MKNREKSFPGMYSALALGVHAFTASAAFIGLLSLLKIHQHEYVQALWLMALAVIIDAVDGSLARRFNVKKVMPKIDGTLLDNIVDYLNYVIAPGFFLLVKPDMLPESLNLWIVFLITITSAYQFCQADAKTPDHFFKGFPCYWNFAVFYMFILNTTMYTNALLLLILCILIFIPVKYVYPSRLDNLTESKGLKILMHLCSILYGISTAVLLWQYPQSKPLWLVISLGYVIMYLILSIYRTYSPMIIAKLNAHKD